MESPIPGSSSSTAMSFRQIWIDRTNEAYKREVDTALGCLRAVWPKERILEKIMKAGDERSATVTLDFEWRWECRQKETIQCFLDEIGCDLTLVNCNETGFTLSALTEDQIKLRNMTSSPMGILTLLSMAIGDDSDGEDESKSECNCMGCQLKNKMIGSSKTPKTPAKRICGKECCKDGSDKCSTKDCCPTGGDKCCCKDGCDKCCDPSDFVNLASDKDSMKDQ